MITHESSLENITDQFDYVLSNYSNHGLSKNNFDHIVMGGLGGSGISAMLAKSWYFNKSSLPIEVVNDYHLPKFVNERSLVILNSYSGNTEETLQMFEEAQNASATILTISSGGKLKELATANNLPHFELPTGYQPRMTIGFGFGILLLTLGELLGIDERIAIEEAKTHFIENNERQLKSAERIYDFFKNTPKDKFVIIADRQYAPVAIRFSQQLNENAKLEAFVNLLPEANHNVLESYTDRLKTNFVLLYSDENDRNSARFDFLISHLEMENNKVLPLVIPEYSVKSLFDVIYRLDWVSVHLANELGAPLMDVPNISNLKEFLSNLEFITEEED